MLCKWLAIGGDRGQTPRFKHQSHGDGKGGHQPAFAQSARRRHSRPLRLFATASVNLGNRGALWNDQHPAEILVATGRRKRAVLELKWQRNDHAGWVDLGAGMIHFLGENEKETSKGRGSILAVPGLLSHLRHWYKADPNADGVITYKGKQVSDIKKAFARACEMAGIEDATPHTLKHTAVTLAFQSEMTMEQATQYFATSLETLDRVYRKHSPLHNRAAIGPMQRLGKQ